MSLAGLLLFLFLQSGYQLLLYAGLLLVAYSKERNDTAYVSEVRAEAFKSVFGFMVSLTIALNLTELLSAGFEAEMPHETCEIGGPSITGKRKYSQFQRLAGDRKRLARRKREKGILEKRIIKGTPRRSIAVGVNGHIHP